MRKIWADGIEICSPAAVEVCRKAELVGEHGKVHTYVVCGHFLPCHVVRNQVRNRCIRYAHAVQDYGGVRH